MQNIIDLINGVGFPISMCIALFYMNREMLTQQKQLLLEFQNTIRDNTEIMKDNNELTKTLIRELNMAEKVVKDEL